VQGKGLLSVETEWTMWAKAMRCEHLAVGFLFWA